VNSKEFEKKYSKSDLLFIKVNKHADILKLLSNSKASIDATYLETIESSMIRSHTSINWNLVSRDYRGAEVEIGTSVQGMSNVSSWDVDSLVLWDTEAAIESAVLYRFQDVIHKECNDGEPVLVPRFNPDPVYLKTVSE